MEVSVVLLLAVWLSSFTSTSTSTWSFCTRGVVVAPSVLLSDSRAKMADEIVVDEDAFVRVRGGSCKALLPVVLLAGVAAVTVAPWPVLVLVLLPIRLLLLLFIASCDDALLENDRPHRGTLHVVPPPIFYSR